MKLTQLKDRLLSEPTVLSSEQNYYVMEQLSLQQDEEIVSNLHHFYEILERLEYSVQESFDWADPNQEPTGFVIFLEGLSSRLGGSKELDHYIKFFKWSMWNSTSL